MGGGGGGDDDDTSSDSAAASAGGPVLVQLQNLFLERIELRGTDPLEPTQVAVAAKRLLKVASFEELRNHHRASQPASPRISGRQLG